MRIWFDISNSPHINMFCDLIRELEKEGHVITITSRNLANTIELLEQRHLKHTIVGEHYGKNLYKKLLGYPIRVLQLRNFLANKNLDLAVSQSSFHSPVVAKLLGIPAIYSNDNEHALGNVPSFIFATKILLPEYLSAAKAKRQGAGKSKIVHYPGVKEGIYLWQIAESIKAHRKNNRSVGSLKIYVRPEPLTAQYYQGGINFLDTALCELQNHYSVIILPRDKTQLHHYKQSKFANLHVVEKTLQLIDIAKDCSLFLGAGGSMTRELACLGVPTISVYQDALLQVDKFLIENGFMFYEPNVTMDIINVHIKNSFQFSKTNELMRKGELAYHIFKEQILSFA